MLALGKDTMIEILKKNFGFKTIMDQDYGLSVIMDARDAFRYSLIEGSPYLVNEYGFSCKGRMNVFYHRSSLNKGFYTYCPGLFGVQQRSGQIFLDEGNAPYYIKKRHSHIFHGKKTILFLEHNAKDAESRAELERQAYETLKKRGEKSEGFLLSIVPEVLPTVVLKNFLSA